MASVWPITLPQAMYFDNLGEILPVQMIASNIPGMTPITYRVSLDGPHEIAGVIPLTAGQKGTFRTFVFTTLGLCLPFQAPATFIGDGLVHIFKFLETPKYKGFGPMFLASLNLEVLS